MNLVFFDIDGTLAIRKDVPLSAQKALHDLRMNGSIVFICTGRSLTYVRKNFYKYANGYICSNGRYAMMGCCETLYDMPLSKEQVDEIRRRLDPIGCSYAFFTQDSGYFAGNEDDFAPMASAWDPGFMKKGIPEDMKAYNFDVCFSSRRMYAKIEEVLKDMCILNPHGPHPTADVTILGADKGTALRAVAEKLGVPIENTYAFGDGMNDLCMLEAAGHGIAMGNAVEELKAKAEFVTTPILEDGVKNGLAHYGLI